MVQKFSTLEAKSLKLVLKIKKIIHVLEKVPFILFFYYDFFNSSERILFRKYLNENNLTTLLIKNEEIKQLNKNLKNQKFYNLFLGNTLFIYNKDQNMMDKPIIKNLISHPKLILIGGKWENKLYRIKQIEKFVTLDDFTVKKSLITELLKVSYVLRNVVSRL